MASSLLPPARLSKSKYIAGLQCHKRLYLEVHHPHLATPPDEEKQAILDMGTEVGELARRRFTGGVLVDVDHRRPTEALKRTAELIADGQVPAIFEGALEFGRTFVRVDILLRATGESGQDVWTLIEVKSSTRRKDHYLDDLAVQVHVATGAGLSIVCACLMHLNNEYVFDGEALNTERLFVIEDVTQAVVGRQAEVAERLSGMQRLLEEPAAPFVEPGAHCHRPYDCPFWDHCTEDKPERWIRFLPGGERAITALVKRGIATIDEIPDDHPLTVRQRQVKANVEWIGAGLRAALETVRYPVHHLDFETVMPAVPRYPGTRVYQAIPTQWSNHIEDEQGNLHHAECLIAEPTDPREELTRALLASLGTEGSICVYSSYERVLLERLAEEFPSLRRDLAAVIARLWDLHEVIERHYYHPAFGGALSIKAVLPALVPDWGYADLAIQSGGLAAQLYARMVFHETDWVEKARIKDALLDYCRRDTLAMVLIRKALRAKVDGMTVEASDALPNL